jgi:hypothetical protein
MTRTRNVYLPRWAAWFSLLFILPIWGLASYQVFLTEKGRADLGFDGWIMMTIVMSAVCAMLFLMGYRKLPALVIEEKDS